MTYKELTQTGVDGFTVKELRDIAKRDGYTIRGRTKRELFQSLQNAIYQRSYAESVARQFKSKG